MADQDGQTVVGNSQSVIGDSLTGEDASTGSGGGSVDQATSGSDRELPGWTQNIPTEHRDYASKFDSFKEFIGEMRKRGEAAEGSVKVPGDDASAEEWDSFMRAVGKPENPDGYELSGADESTLSEFKTMAHEAGLTKKQASALFERYMKLATSQREAIQKRMVEQKEQVETKLKEEWGKDYDANINAMQRFAKKFGSPEAAKAIAELGIGNNETLIKMFVNAGKALSNDTLEDGTPVKSNNEPRGTLTYPWMREAYPVKDY